MPDLSSPVYRFGPFVLDVGDRSLKREGVAVALTPKLFDLLVALVANAGRLVEKDVLLQTVWPDVAVEEGNLTKSVFGLRQVLGQEGGTLPVNTDAAADAAERVDEIAPTAPMNAIAVLPFADMSSDRDQDFFCEGMSEEIINALGRTSGLRVASYTSSARFKGRGTDAREIGRDLIVSWLLEGSVRKAGDAVRIAVQLIRASDGFTAWSGRFDRQLESVFAVQDEIAAMIAQTLASRVGSQRAPLVTSKTRDAEAYSLYLEGRYLWNKRPGDVVWQALDRFERAVALDPSFAPAHAAIASVYGTLGAWESGLLPPAEALAKAKAAAAKALELDPLLAAGHTASAYATLHFDWNPVDACREFDQALALNPAWVDAHHWQSHALCAAGRFSESLAACRQSLELDPLNPLMHAHLAWHHYMAREYEQALVQSDKVIRVEPSFHWGHFFRGWALERLGRPAEAIPSLQEAVRCSGESPVMLAGLGHGLASNQDRRKAIRVAADLESKRKDRGLYAYEIGVIHATLGDHGTAIDWFGRAVQERSGWMAYVGVDPRLDALRADHRFRSVLATETPRTPSS
jgi:serine/threonine-protein kinase